jgi:hypothetical protein
MLYRMTSRYRSANLMASRKALKIEQAKRPGVEF